MAARILGITGTDTGVGKTVVATAVLAAAAARGLATIGLKPVAAGCVRRGDGWVNDDALALQAAATERLDYASVNPVAFEAPIAPHIAAAEAGVELSAAELIAHCREQAARNAELVVIEGAGGWQVPLNQAETLADVFAGLDAAMILVIGMKLGCLNHALLTADSIRQAGLEIVGWVANRIDPKMAAFDANLATLRRRMPGRHLGTLPHVADVVEDIPDVSGCLDINELLSR